MHTQNRTAPTVILWECGSNEVQVQTAGGAVIDHTAARTTTTNLTHFKQNSAHCSSLIVTAQHYERECGPHEVQVQTLGGRRRCHWARCSKGNWLRELLRVRIPDQARQTVSSKDSRWVRERERTGDRTNMEFHWHSAEDKTREESEFDLKTELAFRRSQLNA